VRLPIDRIEPRTQRSAAEPSWPTDSERDCDDEPEAHHEEEDFHVLMVARLESTRDLAHLLG
jgi:hypothetical protein